MTPRRWRPAPLIRLSAALHAAAVAAVCVQPAWWPGALAAVLANHALLGAAGMWPHSTWLGPTLHRLPSAGSVALTFDDGPDPHVTPQVLALLHAAGATASFFCIARRAAAHPALVDAILAGGHRIENHTSRHPRFFAAMSPGGMRREVAAAQATLTALGAAPQWFRPPMGLRSPFLEPALASIGLHAISWTRRGYDTVSRDPARVLRHLTRGLRGGDVLLLHDGNAARTSTGTPMVLAVLPDLLRVLAASGLSAAALPDAAATLAAGPGTPASAEHASR